MDDPSPVRIGLVGAGRMGNLHAGHLKTLGTAQVVAACDIIPERAEHLAAVWNGRAYTDYREMLDRESLDAVYVCTPTDCHGQIALDCVERGLHLFVEKPLELDLALAGELVRRAEAAGVIATTAFHWRYSRGFQEAVRLVDGRPVALVNLRWYWTRPPIRWMWDRNRAGGQIVDQNIHLIDLSQALAGDIVTVYAAYNERQTNFDEGFHNWDGYAVTFHYRSGAVGLCAGTYALFPEIQAGPTADFALRDELIRVTDQGAARFTPRGVEEWRNQEPFHLGVNRAFIQAVRSRDPAHLHADLRTGLYSTAVTLAANRSAQTGHPVDVAEFLREHGWDGPYTAAPRLAQEASRG